MGDGFVAGRFDTAGERFGRMYGAFFHAGILAWGVRSKNFIAEVTERTEFGETNLYVCTVLIAQHLATLRNFLSTLTYYLVQEKLYVSTWHDLPNCRESRNVTRRAFCIYAVAGGAAGTSRAGTRRLAARFGHAVARRSRWHGWDEYGRR